MRGQSGVSLPGNRFARRRHGVAGKEKDIGSGSPSLILLETMGVNQYVFHCCSRKKYPREVIAARLFLYTLFIAGLLFFISARFGLTVMNKYIILLGLTYYFPLTRLYDETWDKILTIMAFSWVHSILVTYLAAQLSLLLHSPDYYRDTLLIQTAIYAITTPGVILHVRGKFLYIIKNIPDEIKKYFFILELVQFAMLALFYFYLIDYTFFSCRLCIAAAMAASAVLSFQLVYILVRNFGSIAFLKQLAYSDALTGIKNRMALYFDCERLFAKNKPFTLYFYGFEQLQICQRHIRAQRGRRISAAVREGGA
jgi:hypothetical protein